MLEEIYRNIHNGNAANNELRGKAEGVDTSFTTQDSTLSSSSFDSEEQRVGAGFGSPRLSTLPRLTEKQPVKADVPRANSKILHNKSIADKHEHNNIPNLVGSIMSKSPTMTVETDISPTGVEELMTFGGGGCWQIGKVADISRTFLGGI